MSISDLNLNFNEIKENIKIVPTKVIRRGQLVGYSKNKKAPYDICLYEEKITNEEKPFGHLDNLLNELLPYCEYIKKISKLYDQVDINCYIRSDFGQIGFTLTSEVINMIKIFGININFHILSFGEVEDK